jgi:diguanylate cyclase (GGDEF)-like protein/PAS domain S-box-containing protein
MPDKANFLRIEAEARLIRLPQSAESPPSAQELLHELRVHQIELEMQIEKLRRAQVVIEVSRDQALLQNSMEGIHIMDVEGNVIEVNDAFCNMLGYTRDEALKMNVADWDARWTREALREKFQLLIGKKAQFETVHRRKDGALVHVEITSSGMEIDGKSYLYAASRDITERKKIEEELRMAAVTFETHDAILITDRQANIIRVNQAFTDITGYSPEDVLGQNPRIMSSGRQDKAFYLEMWQQLLHTGSWAGEIWDKRKNGQVYPKWMTITAVRNDIQETTHYVAIFSDITARKQTEEEIRNLAFYDALTRLPNRRLFLDRFRAALTISTRSNDYGALLFIDMDRFKTLNDMLGHDYGDLLLVEVADRIKSCVREMDTVARLGGDEFVVLIEGLSENSEESSRKVGVIAEKIREALVYPYKLKSHEHRCSPSIGISLYRGNENSVDELLQQADMAMYQAKGAGRNAVRFFDPVMKP